MLLRRFLASAAFACACSFAATAHAANDYTDTWWAAGGTEEGWGVNLTQQKDFIYGTFYIYGQDGKATWLTAQMSRDGTGEIFKGGLFRVTGTWYGSPTWNGYQITPVGNATFTASSAYDGELVYTVDGSTITKRIERLKMVDLSVAGDFRGAVAGTRSGCSANGSFTDLIDFLVLHSPTTGEIRIDQYNANTGFASAAWKARPGNSASCCWSRTRRTTAARAGARSARASTTCAGRRPASRASGSPTAAAGAPRAATSRASRTAEPAHALEQHHGGGGGGVERLHAARHRDRHPALDAATSAGESPAPSLPIASASGRASVGAVQVGAAVAHGGDHLPAAAR